MRKKILHILILLMAGLSTVTELHAAEPADTLASRPGGKYIWIPDSLASDVKAILLGAPDLNEMTVYRGDTIPMVLKSRNFGRFERGLSNYLFIPKGVWSVGLSVSYGEFTTENLEVLDLLNDIDIGGHIFSIHPYVSYFIRNNVSLGLKIGYYAAKGSINSFNVDIDDDMSFNLHDIEYRSKSYSAALALRQYWGVSRRGRFGIFNEIDLLLGSGSSDFVRPYNGALKNTHTDIFKTELNFMPGVGVFILPNVSFNISFGVFGFHLRNEKQRVDNEKLGDRFSSGANFKFNIFNINFGIEAHF